MSARRTLLRVLCGAASATLGSALLVLGLWAMNSSDASSVDRAATTKTTFSLPEVKREPPPKKEREQKARRTSRRGPAKAPPALAAAGLSGPSFGIASLALGDLGPPGKDLLGDTADVTMTEDTVDVLPRPSERASPAYPPRARQAGVEGEVVMNLLITPEGRVADARVLEARPAGVFEEAARTAVLGWRFSPALYQGRPVKTWARQRVVFALR